MGECMQRVPRGWQERNCDFLPTGRFRSAESALLTITGLHLGNRFLLQHRQVSALRQQQRTSSPRKDNWQSRISLCKPLQRVAQFRSCTSRRQRLSAGAPYPPVAAADGILPNRSYHNLPHLQYGSRATPCRTEGRMSRQDLLRGRTAHEPEADYRQ